MAISFSGKIWGLRSRGSAGKSALFGVLLLLLAAGAALFVLAPSDAGSPETEAAPSILFLAGPPSHAADEHLFEEGSQLLADALEASGFRATVSVGWPEDASLVENAIALVLFSDGLGDHVAKGQTAALRRHVEAGGGLCVLHFSLEPDGPDMAALFEEVLGGYFVVDYSVNPIWKLEEPLLGDHPVTSGVRMEPVVDEWYYHLQLSDAVIPVLQGHPPPDSLGDDGPRSGNPYVRRALADGVPQTLGWVHTTDSGARTFGFTGGHYHVNWNDDGFRRLVLNAIVWTAQKPLPEDGIDSSIEPLVRYATIDIAIARDDPADVRRHLAANPETLNQGKHPNLTPLHQAILRQRPEIAALLIEAGADTNQVDQNDRTPLHLAVDRNLAEIARILIERGADLSALDSKGWTALHHAAARNNYVLSKLLIEGGHDVTQLSRLGGTPMHEAALQGDAKLLQMLLDAGVDPSVVSSTGVTALDIAQDVGNEAAIRFLSEIE
ncbi:MAG: hypothetical protein EA353_12025 [Puniceicoccaceae bacterium]|nr:MAG: hypothetical protein EA353_12025 [Puniceicoccaceae bacterium]